MFNVDTIKGNSHSVKGIKQQRQEKPAQRLLTVKHEKCGTQTLL